MKGACERCIEHGMDDSIAKPIQTRELDEVLARVEAPPRIGQRPQSCSHALPARRR